MSTQQEYGLKKKALTVFGESEQFVVEAQDGPA